MDEVCWGIIGCGDVTEVKSGPALQKADGSRLVAVMRRNGDLAADYARRHEVPRWYDDAQALIADPEVNAVYIATPPYMHMPYTLMAASAGKPVYVEKPMALTTAECQQMINACAEASVPLFTAYYRRALPRFGKIKEIIESGILGEIRHIQMTLTQPLIGHPGELLHWHGQPEISGGGHFVDLACHTLDYLDYVFGPVRRVWGTARNQGGAYPAEDIVSGVLEFPGGVIANGLWSFASFAAEDRVMIVGSKGQLSFATFAHDPIRLQTHHEVESFDIPHPPHVQQPLIQQVVNELLGRGRCVSTGNTASRTTWVMEQLLAPYYRQR